MDKKSRDLVMAKLYLKNRDYKMAEKSFDEYLKIMPEDVNALKLMAQVYEHNKRFDKAFEMYERCYLAEPDRTGVLLDICRILLMNEVWLENVDYRKWLNLAIHAFPSNPIVSNFKAFLATLPPDEQASPRHLPTKADRKLPTDDTLAKIFEKLCSLENRLGNIEDKIADFTKKQSCVEPKPEVKATLTPVSNLFSSQNTPPPAFSTQNNEKSNDSIQNLSKQEPVTAPFSFKSSLSFGQTTPIKTPDIGTKLNTSTDNSTGPEKNNSPFNFSGGLFSAAPTTTNFFADSMKKLNIENSWNPVPSNSPFSFSQPAEPQKDQAEDCDGGDDDKVQNEELAIENTCTMQPIDIKTGEEDEDVLFEHRCKLYRLRDGEYKERGLGSIKVLKNRDTGRGRLIMRREVIGLVCLNCWGCKKIERIRENQVRWIGLDASDGEPDMTIFLVKFKTPESTDVFMSHLTSIFDESESANNSINSPQPKKTEDKAASNKPEVELIDPKIDPNLVDKARKLQLPDLFYHELKNQGPCTGCNGCEKDD